MGAICRLTLIILLCGKQQSLLISVVVLAMYSSLMVYCKHSWALSVSPLLDICGLCVEVWVCVCIYFGLLLIKCTPVAAETLRLYAVYLSKGCEVTCARPDGSFKFTIDRKLGLALACSWVWAVKEEHFVQQTTDLGYDTFTCCILCGTHVGVQLQHDIQTAVSVLM